jgi:transcription antitermination factor NusG
MGTELIIPNISFHVDAGSFAGEFPWYAIRTRSNHERVASIVLQGKGYDPYLPLYRAKKPKAEGQGERPLFPGYVFCRFDVRKRLPIVTTTGVISILGVGREPVAIPDGEMEAVRAVLRSGLAAEPCAYLREGQRVRITHGSLEGVEGILVKIKSQVRMVISVTMLQRSISVEIDRERLSAM